jgi:hypothetical protein
MICFSHGNRSREKEHGIDRQELHDELPLKSTLHSDGKKLDENGEVIGGFQDQAL